MTAREGRARDLTLRSIMKGQVATFEVDGVFIRGPAPSDGLLVETTTASIFVPMEELRHAGIDLVSSV